MLVIEHVAGSWYDSDICAQAEVNNAQQGQTGIFTVLNHCMCLAGAVLSVLRAV